MPEWIRSHRVGSTALAIGGVVAVIAGIFWFAPQRLFLDRTVSEALPTVSIPPEPAGAPPEDGAAEGDPGGDDGSAVVELGAGSFRSLEHETRGVAKVVELADGSRYVRLEDLNTSDGPDLRVYLTDQPLSDDWRVWDDGAFVDLGTLKGNIGDANYRIPQAVDLADVRTVVIWCRRFAVGFGVAPL